MKIKLELDQAVFGNLRTLVIAGVKSTQTPESAIFAGAQILQLLDQAMENSKKTPPKPTIVKNED
jgi:hypothetical protein